MSKKEIESIYPLSPAQQGMFYETVQAPSSGIHIEQLSCTLSGLLALSALERVWQWEVNRHAILRTCFVWEGQPEPLQVLLRQVDVPIERQDWRELSSAEQSRRLDAYLEEDRQRGFKLSQAPLMRLALFQLQEYSYQFVWTRHHILMDGWCSHMVLQEVFSCYQAFSQGQDFHLPPSRPYQDYIAWLRQQDLSQAERFWRKTLQGFTQPTPLGKTGTPESAPRLGERSGSLMFSLSASTTVQLQTLARQHRLTLNTLLQGCWALLLSRYSKLNDVVFGITVSGRPAELVKIETMVGLCINTLPIRVRLTSGQTLWSWLAEIQSYNLALREFEYTPGGQVHQWSELPGALLLYESLLVVENYPASYVLPESTALDISISNPLSRGAQTKYALTILVVPDAELQVWFIYDRRRFENADIQRVLEHFQVLLERLAADTDQEIFTLRDTIPGDQIPTVRPLLRRTHQGIEPEYEAPRDPVEGVLADICASVLGTERVGIHDDFFAFGGHSLLATQVISQLRTIWQVELPVRSLFDSPTIAELAQIIMEQYSEQQDCVAAAIKWIEQKKAEQLIAQLDHLSDEEVDSALRELLLEEKVDE